MGNNALDIVVGDSGSDIELNRFQLLWNKIEKCEQRNAKAEIKVDKLYDDYNSVLFPHEKRYGESHCALVAHLLSFVPSGDLRKRDRLHLLEYLSDHMDKMYAASHIYDLSVVESIRKGIDKYYEKYFSKERQQAIDSEYDEMKDMLSMALGEEVDLPDEALKEAIVSGDFAKVSSLLEEAKRSYMENNKQEDEDWDDFEFNYYHREDDESSKVKEIFKGSQLNKMYKKIANIIHPDKEQDDDKKAQKHKQMQLLIEAKRNSDVFTLIKMYQEFVPDGEYFLDDDAMEHVEHLLQMQVQKLNQAHREIFSGQGHKSYVWKSYSSTSRKRSLQKMDAHVFEIERHISAMDNKVAQLDTAKKIKKQLLSRYV
jgi:hypothetical protein